VNTAITAGKTNWLMFCVSYRYQ